MGQALDMVHIVLLDGMDGKGVEILREIRMS